MEAAGVRRPLTRSRRITRLGLLVPVLAVLAACGDGPAGSADTPADPEWSTGAQEPTAGLFPADLPAVQDPTRLMEEVRSRARALAQQPWTPPQASVPPELAELDYDGYRRIRFRDERALWGPGTSLDDPSSFRIQFFHPGYLFTTPVLIHEVGAGQIRPIPFDPTLFQYGVEAAEGWPGWAGFRVLFPLNAPERFDEAASFIGAAYFRLLGPGHVYGLSARGIAVDTTGERREEFPDFREFWLVRPSPGDETLTFYALLDGPSITGAYRFVLAPHGTPEGTEVPRPDGMDAEAPASVLEVEAHLFARSDIARLGVAPLTSMFLFDENRGRDFDDVRPRVHDSDGLLMVTRSGEWIWRPLSNGPGLRVSSLRDVDPQGFGLLQRERRFDRYLDLEARYHDRPSLWVEPLGEGWGAGGVELVEIPTNSEFEDNVVAYWAPDEPFRAGEERSYRYRLISFDDHLPAPAVGRVHSETGAPQRPGRVVRHRHGWDALPGEANPPPRSRRRFVVDFEPPTPPGAEAASSTAGSPGDPGPVPEVQLQASAGRVEGLRIEPLPEPAGGWRVSFALDPNGAASDLRLFLTRDNLAITETWSFLWIPDHD